MVRTWQKAQTILGSGRKPTKVAGKCIFCSGGNLSHEHFWPDWADKLLPGTGGGNVERRMIITKKNEITHDKTRERQGAVKGKTIRVVCETCNTGWMSRLEDRLKPILTPLILGKPTIITSEAQYALARWITLKIMVGEQNVRENAVFTQAQRDQFRMLLLTPPQIKIWIGDCGRGGWATAYVKDAGDHEPPGP